MLIISEETPILLRGRAHDFDDLAKLIVLANGEVAFVLSSGREREALLAGKDLASLSRQLGLFTEETGRARTLAVWRCLRFLQKLGKLN